MSIELIDSAVIGLNFLDPISNIIETNTRELLKQCVMYYFHCNIAIELRRFIAIMVLLTN